METDKTNLDDRLVLIYNDLQKIIRHFKIDRRSKNNPDDQTEAEDTAAGGSAQQLREILARIGEIADRRKFTAEQIGALQNICSEANKALINSQEPKHQELKSFLEVIGQQIDELKTERRDSTVKHQHTYTIDFQNSKAATTILLMGIAIFFSAILHIHQLDKINTYKDNDLKYRYIKMQGGITAEGVAKLQDFFGCDRSKKAINNMRKDVEQYEQAVTEQAEKQEQARLNSDRAEELHQKAETLKNKR